MTNEIKGTITINIETTEQELIESCIMRKIAGYEYKPILFFYAFGDRWNIKKLIYYLDLIEGLQ